MNKLMWPGILFVMIGASVVVHAVMLVVVNTDASFAVDNRYRAKTDPWWQMVNEAKQADATGWNASLTVLSTTIDGLAELRLSVIDRDGALIEDARAEIRLFHRATAGDVHELTFHRDAGGGYSTLASMDRKGWWKATVLVTKDDQQFADTFDLLAGL